MRQTGTKAFAAVDDLAKALGKTVTELGASRLSSRIEMFRQIGARIMGIRQVKTFEDIARMTPNNGSITMFNIFGKRMEGGFLRPVGHAVYAFRDNLGRLRILDRGGSAGRVGELVDSLEELAKKYGLHGNWNLKEAAVMENVFAKFMTSISSAPVFALGVYALAGVNKLENETIAQAFEIHKAIMQKGKKSLEQGNPNFNLVTSGDSLSKVSMNFYNNIGKWPIIYEANRDVIGNDPNMIRPGQRLFIPTLPIA